MTLFQRPTAIFSENVITRAERAYQKSAASNIPLLQPWLSRTLLYTMITVALTYVGDLLFAALTLHDPIPIVRLLGPVAALFVLLGVFYNFYLMIRTISLTANSITREKQTHTWELLVLTDVNARQIVQGKWWATVQQQFSRYLFLGVIRLGVTAAYAMSVSASSYYTSNNYKVYLQLPHPVTILIAVFFGIAFTIANLVFSAACGVMASAVNQRGSWAILRGFLIQIVLSVVPALLSLMIFMPFYSTSQLSFWDSISQAFGWGGTSLIDNGYSLLLSPLTVNYSPYTDRLIAPLSFGWIISSLVALVLYGLLIWFALLRAEKRAVRALATPAA